MNLIFRLLIGCICCLPVFLQAQNISWEPDPSVFVSDGPVKTMIRSGNTLYLGGKFNFIGPNTGSGASFTASSQMPDQYFPRVNGEINAVEADGSGGWYIAGDFTRVGNFNRERVAHILADGNVDPSWIVSADSMVISIFRQSGRIYLGGQFQKINGNSRKFLAAVSESGGQLLSWNPLADQPVLSLAGTPGKVYVGGLFSVIGGQLRNRLAELNESNGLASQWNPDVGGAFVSCIDIRSGRLYAGGQFIGAGGQARNNAACFQLGTGTLTGWNPNPAGTVLDFAFSPGKVVLGGIFSTVGTNNLNIANLGMVDTISGQVFTTWNPQINNNVVAMQLSSDTLYLAGNFSQVGDSSRQYLAAIRLNDGLPLSWNPGTNGTAIALKKQGNRIFAGGQFSSVGMQYRQNLAAVNTADGKVLAWNPSANDSVSVLKYKDGIIYAAGGFNSVGGFLRNRFAAIDSVSGMCTPIDLSPSAEIFDLAFYSGKLIAGGRFSSIGGQSRSGLAMIDLASGDVDAWNPQPSNSVTALAVRGNTIYVAGLFTSIGGQSRNRLAALNAITGNANNWNPGCDGVVRKLLVSNSLVYVAGSFFSLGGLSRNNLGCVDAFSGIATQWNPIANRPVRDIQKKGNKVYAAGEFSSAGLNLRNYAAEIDSATGQTSSSSWNPQILFRESDYAECLSISSDRIWLGGKLSSIGQRGARTNFASFVINPPQTEIQIVSGGAIICEGDSTVLESSLAGSSYLWLPGGQTSRRITVKTSGNYSLLVQAANGLYATDEFSVSVNPTIPASIQTAGPTAFCKGGSVGLTASEGSSYLWSNGDTTQSTLAQDSGYYSVIVSQLNGCSSRDSVLINAKPLPASLIDSSGSLHFCQGESVDLCGPENDLYQYVWSNGNVGRCIVVSQTGNYNLRTILNGCTSAVRPPVRVEVKPRPPKPVIVSSGPLSICQNECVTLSAPSGGGYDSLAWSTDAGTSSIQVCQTVTIFLTVFRDGCPSLQSNARTVLVNPLPPKPSIVALGPTEFCIGDSVSLSGAPGLRYRWNNGDTNQVTRVKTSQNLFLRVLSGPNCFSPPSDSINIISKPITSVLVQPANDTVCYLAPFQLAVQSAGYNQQYQWFRNGSPLSNGVAAVFSKNQAELLDTGFYFVRVSGDCGNAESQAARLSVPYFQRARLDSIPSRLPCLGDTVIIRSANPVANASFRWYKNGEEIQGAPSRAFFLASDSGFYHVRQFLGSCGSPFYDSVFVRYRDKPRPPRPELSISPGLPALCSDNFTLSFNPAPGLWDYQWYSDTGPVQGQTGNSYTGNLPGNYFVRIEAIENGQPNGCFNKSTDFPVYYTGPFSIAQPRINSVSTERIPGDTLRNRITWRRPPVPNPSVKETRIYRQTSVAGDYEQIGTISNGDTSFLDNSAEPWQKPWFYKIAAEAYCSGTSGPTYLTQASPFHKTTHLIIIRSAVSTALNLIWNAYEGFPVSSYRIYRGSSPDNQIQIDSVAGNILSYTDFPPGQTGNWFYSIEAETQEIYLPWGRILATGGRKVRSNTRPTTQGIVVNDDSTLLENPLRVVLPESSISATVYPNPSSGWFRIRGGMEGRSFELRCFDPVGKLCFTRKLSGNFDSMLELPSMSGVYFLELTSSGTRRFFRMLRN